MPAQRGKILVVRGGAIGDFILTLPAIAALRSTFPETHLEVLGYPRVAELAKAGGLIDGFRSIEAGPLSRFFARNAKLDEGWVEYFESFHLIISYLYDPDEIFRTNVGRATKAQFIQGQHRPDENGDVHATAVFLKPLEKLAIFDADAVPRISVPRPAERDSLEGDEKWVAVHPGSGSERKNWPEENWVELLRWLQTESNRKVLLVGGEAEADRLPRIARALVADRVQLVTARPLVELAGLLARCEMFLGHDSGITHLAAAVGCKVIALWGHSKRKIWEPRNAGVQALEAPEGALEELRAAAVIDVVKQELR
ncbi:MAG: glycosyltransferase family 9 protein [Limisphaerales bacterium]